VGVATLPSSGPKGILLSAALKPSTGSLSAGQSMQKPLTAVNEARVEENPAVARTETNRDRRLPMKLSHTAWLPVDVFCLAVTVFVSRQSERSIRQSRAVGARSRCSTACFDKVDGNCWSRWNESFRLYPIVGWVQTTTPAWYVAAKQAANGGS
jgi:hypothetical protein